MYEVDYNLCYKKVSRSKLKKDVHSVSLKFYSSTLYVPKLIVSP